ncbi:ankyrin repeat-containing domain protein [Lentinula raphanica]|nr:ankyrin repeat-containing domain protein [Lentinula raphanica]
MCLIYLLNQNEYTNSGTNTINTFEQYATQYWAKHSQYNERELIPNKDTIELIELFLKSSQAFEGHNVELLVQHGADVNTEGGRSGTAIQVAAVFEGDKDTSTLFAEHNADVYAHGEKFGTAIQAIVAGSYTETMESLVQQGTDIQYGTSLYAAATTKTSEFLIHQSADINATQSDRSGSAIQDTAAEGHTEPVESLVQQAADVNTQNGNVNTALHAAATVGHTEAVECHIQQNTDINAQCEKSHTAIHAAAAGDYTEPVKFFVQEDANVHTQKGNFGTSLHEATTIDTLTFFLHQSADINAQGHESDTRGAQT